MTSRGESVLQAVQTETSTEIVLASGPGAASTTPVPGISLRDNVPSFAWTRNGQMLISFGDRLIRQRSDGTGVVTILSDPAAWISSPVSCDDDRWIAVSWMFHGEKSANRIWRVNSDGSNAVVLTRGEFDRLWGCSPDGKWLYYSDHVGGTGVLRLSADGGEEAVVPGTSPPNSLLSQATLSADGRTLALFTQVLKPETKSYFHRIVFVGPDSSTRNLDLDPGLNVVFSSPGPPSSAAFHFTPDGKSVAFVVDDGVENIWIQPIDGSKGHKLTNFKNSDTIQDFRWSPDGKALALLRFNSISDVTILRNRADTSRAPK